MKHKTTKHGSARRANSQNSTLRMKTTYDDVLMRTMAGPHQEAFEPQSYRYWESKRGRGGSFVITPGVWRGWEKWIFRGTVGQASDAYRKSLVFLSALVSRPGKMGGSEFLLYACSSC